MPDPTTDSFDLLLYIWKQRKPVIIITVLGALISIVVSLLLKPKFAAEVILYPTSSASVSRSLISTQGGYGKEDLLAFGDEEETEKMLQILYSDEIRNRLIEKYHLFEHYRIPADAKYKYTILNAKMHKNISFRKTEYMAVRIRVMDEDPKTSALMANDIAMLLDSTVNRMQKKKAIEALSIVEKEYRSMQLEIAGIEDSVRKLGKLGIFDVESQSKGLQEAYLEAIHKGDVTMARALNEKMINLGKYGSNYLFLKELLSNESVRFSGLKEKYSEARVDAEQNLPHTYIVKKADVPEKKAWPKRSIIVMGTTLAAFLFAIILLLFLDAIRKRLN
ncbi:MAG: hypothetical protein GXO83_05795 [Chlorobi bacterium]|nr:hypothetical protein [Chlorobiota bacterium]